MEFVINFVWNVPKWTRNGILNTHHHLFATEECACESQCAFSSEDQIFRQHKLARLYLHHPATCNSLEVQGERRGALQVTCSSAASRPAERLPWDWQTPAAQAHLMRKDWPSLSAGEFKARVTSHLALSCQLCSDPAGSSGKPRAYRVS